MSHCANSLERGYTSKNPHCNYSLLSKIAPLSVGGERVFGTRIEETYNKLCDGFLKRRRGLGVNLTFTAFPSSRALDPPSWRPLAVTAVYESANI